MKVAIPFFGGGDVRGSRNQLGEAPPSLSDDGQKYNANP